MNVDRAEFDCLSLCSGVGMLDEGVALAVPGMRTVGYVERDAFAAATLLGRSPVSAKAPTTNGGSGRPSQGSFATFDRASYSWRTSLALFPAEDSTPFSGRWPKWGSMRSGAVFERERWEPATDASEFSSWATPQAHDAQGPKTPEQIQLMRERTGAGVRNLNEEAAHWPTPSTAPDAPNTNSNQKNGIPSLGLAAKHWPTPVANDDNKSLEAHLAMKRRMKGGPRTQPTSLQVVAKAWPTPNARDHKGRDLPTRHGGASLSHATETGEFSHPAPEPSNGPRSSVPAPGSRRRAYRDFPHLAMFSSSLLVSAEEAPGAFENDSNVRCAWHDLQRKVVPPRLAPPFVSWLMGWPWFWTQPVPISFAQSETEWWRSKLRSHLQSLLGDPELSLTRER